MIKTAFYFGMIVILLFGRCTPKAADKADDARNDSIQKYLDLAGDLNLNFEKRKKCNDKAYSYLDLSQNDSITRWNLYSLGINNANLLRFNELKKNSDELYYLSSKSNNQSSIADLHRLKGLGYMFESNNVKAIECFYMSKKLLLRQNALKRIIAINKDIAQVQFFSCDFLGSNKTLFENLEFIKNTSKKLSRNFLR